MLALRRSPGALLVVFSSLAVASGASVLARPLSDSFEPASAVAAAIVVTLVFWWRTPEGLLAFGTVALLADTLDRWIGVDLQLFDEVGLLLLISAAIVSRRIQTDRLRAGWLEWAVASLAVIGVISSIVAGVPIITWIAGLVLLLKGLAFFFLLSWLRLSVEDVERMGVVVLAIGGIVGVLGFVEWLDPSAFQQALGLPEAQQARGNVTVIRSIFLHPALFGWLTAFASLLLYARFIVLRTWWALPAAIVFNVGTFFSGRRTPLLGVLAAVTVGLVQASTRLGIRRAALTIWLPAAGVILVAAVALTPWLNRIALETAYEYGFSSSAAAEVFADEPRAELVAAMHPRVALYLGSAAVARDHLPLGGGLGRFGSHMSRADYSPLYEEYGLDQVRSLQPGDPQAATDAFWPMILGETGVLGLIAALALFGGIAVKLWNAAMTGSSPRARAIAVAGLLVFVEGLVRSATSSVFVAPPIAYFVLGAAGAALGVARLPAAAVDPSERR